MEKLLSGDNREVWFLSLVFAGQWLHAALLALSNNADHGLSIRTSVIGRLAVVQTCVAKNIKDCSRNEAKLYSIYNLQRFLDWRIENEYMWKRSVKI